MRLRSSHHFLFSLLLLCGLAGQVSSVEAVTTCSGTNTYATTGPLNNCKQWCQTQSKFTSVAPNWANYCLLPAAPAINFCNDPSRVGLYTTGTSWFTQCGLTTPALAYADPIGNAWCQNTTNFTNVLWAANCKPAYCAEVAHIGAAECRANQTITVTIAAPVNAVLNSTFQVAATSSSGLSVAITISGSCLFDAGVVTMRGAACTVRYNQAGNANYLPATPVTNVTNVTMTTVLDPMQVSAGSSHTCVLDSTGVICWGAGTTNMGVGPDLGQSMVPALVNPIQVSAGLYSTCALESAGVNCWGYTNPGQPALVDPVQVSDGSSHTCALDSTGVHCWGWNGNGQTTVPSLVNPIQVSVGRFHTCALDSTGVHCWGDSQYAQTAVPVLVNPVQISVRGGDHSCALDDTGVHCWGLNGNGQTMVPVLINPVQVSAGGAHTCALDSAGVHCWGLNDYGQTTVPVLIDPVQVSAGWKHTCAIDSTGVKCWGRNNYNQATSVPGQYTQENQTITVTTSAPVSAVINSTFPVAATASSGLSVAITASGGCTLATGTVTMLSSAVDCILNFNQAGNVHYFAAPQITSTVTALADADNDAVADISDNCRLIANTNQLNMDADTLGDVCDGDIDGDGVPNGIDANPLSNATTTEIKLPLDGTHKGAVFNNAVRR